ncbi:ABC transporter permease [Psychrobacter cryohalolentis]|uniref:Binding-protein-dependent transport systems inner membrane component n=1 Tax=Psychrobacter cryohalolentis (strain ATCC BAA-1226 / DSM 17306 / VKM B-2378 / K5) TaxID=335284 RepID=Q1Q9Z9_PSYCK|nr:iron ABC transporter permease [Psychrobacter cryohalolentis]ABE75504.1 binding-protein-dependent transport systems inner membrane component [Psychrobacter cryohalolentis K5]ASE25694.1 iron ABC transporter permease [Psychrobacter cryohalolentis]
MITMPESSASQNNTVNESNETGNTSKSIRQDHATRKRVISKSVLGLISLFMLIPILIVLLSWTQPVADIWGHMREYVLPQVLKNTAILLLMVTVISGTIGTALAWLTSMYRFPGQRFFSWALMLPLAMPAYVLAFVTVGIVDFSGPLQTALRDFGVTTAIPSVRNVWGAGLILSLAFYPYVYLLARQAFLSQGRRAIEAGQMLGLSRGRVFFRLALPQALPWVIGGLLLASMETLADFGAVSVFNVDTFTTAIYKAWFGFFSLTTAAQLAALLIGVVFIVVLFEQYWQAKRGNTITQGSSQRFEVSKPAKLAMTLLCTLVFLIAFLIPFAQLIYWTAANFQQDFDARYIDFVTNSLMIASITTAFIAVLAIMIAWIKRQYPDKSTKLMTTLANLGYVVPGTVLAVGIFIPIAWLDNQLIAYGITSTQFLSGSVIVMLLALSTRFMTVSFQPVDRQLQRLTVNQEAAAKLLSDSPFQRWRQVMLPVLSPGVLTGLLMGFVEVMKEMPITLMTRRQGWDTLAVRVFEMTSEGMWGRAALPSLLIVLVGLIPVWILLRQSDKQG